jgi:hypothetical protein
MSIGWWIWIAYIHTREILTRGYCLVSIPVPVDKKIHHIRIQWVNNRSYLPIPVPIAIPRGKEGGGDLRDFLEWRDRERARGREWRGCPRRFPRMPAGAVAEDPWNGVTESGRGGENGGGKGTVSGRGDTNHGGGGTTHQCGRLH